MIIHGFNWDEGNAKKCQIHGVGLDEIENVFQNALYVDENYKHATSEDRFNAVGKTENGKYIFVVFTLRTVEDQTLVRPISARYMHKKEIDHYEKQIKT